MGYDSMMWQSPALSMTAQAFLFTLTLSSGVPRLPRILAACLSITLAILAIQLMSRHRQQELTDSVMLEKLEEQLGLAIDGCRPHAPADVREAKFAPPRGKAADRYFFRARWLTGHSSYRLWISGQALFAVAAAIAILVSVLSPGLLGGGH
jgi:hypothetical protein